MIGTALVTGHLHKKVSWEPEPKVNEKIMSMYINQFF